MKARVLLTPPLVTRNKAEVDLEVLILCGD